MPSCSKSVFCAPSQELEESRDPRPDNLGKVSRYYGPPTDPTLDASREHDHRTRWERLSRGERWLIGALIAVVIGGYAWVAFA
jgi:hypothetical protein